MRKSLFVIIGIAILGAIVAGYGLWQHYAPTGSSFCNFSATVSCDLVNQSIYSEIYSIPVAAIGVLGYLAIAFVSIFVLMRASWAKEAIRGLLWMTIIGTIFQLIFTYIEFFVIRVICPVCVISQIIILIEAVLSIFVFRLAFLKQRDDMPKMG